MCSAIRREDETIFELANRYVCPDTHRIKRTQQVKKL